MKTAALIPLFAALLGAQQAGIEGIVHNQTTGEPLQGVHVRLYSGISIEGAAQAYGAITDQQGRFSVAAMPPGNYVIEAERTGFFLIPGGGFMRRTEIALRPGQRLTQYQLHMLPLIPVRGRVVNEAGDPMPGATVLAATKAVNSTADTADTGPYSSRNTDERGQFRLFVPPGAYYLATWVEPYATSGRVPGGDSMVNLALNGATITYYPNAPDTSSATLLNVKPGSAITGLTLLARKTAPPANLNLSGVVTGAPAGAPVTVFYSYDVPGGRAGNRVDADANGTFLARGLRAGSSQFFAQCSSGDIQLQSELTEVHVDPANLPRVRLALSPGGTLAGKVEVVGGGALGGGKLAVRLSQMGPRVVFITPPTNSNLTAAPGPDGAFRMAGIPPGLFRVFVDSMPEDGYVKTVALNDATVPDQTLDFSRGLRGSPLLKVTVSLSGAEISGEVRDFDGGPVLNPQINVSLVPEANQTPPARTGAAVKDGRYVFKGVPPGKYKIYAADFLRAGNTTAARDALAAAADTVEIKEGDRITKDLKAVAQGVGR